MEAPQPITLVKNRIVYSALVCAVAFSVIGARLVDVMVLRGNTRTAAVAAAPIKPLRGDLVDRNGVLIARDLPVSNLYATPKAFMDPDGAAKALAKVTGTSEARLRKAFAAKRGYVLVQPALTPAERDAVMALGLPGLTFEKGFKRFYPSGRTVAHAVGQVDTSARGVSGLELGLDGVVRGSVTPIQLSFDIRIQHALQREIADTARRFHAVAAAGLVMNVHTGEVLALTSLPDYEPNLHALAPGDSIRNRITQDVYELGSIFKIFAFAEAVEEGTVDPDEMIDIDTPLRFGRFAINDYDDHGSALSAAMVFADSSNIGTARIGLRSGPEKQKAFLQKLGLLSPLSTEVPEIAAPLYPKRWAQTETATVSFGHGISVNPLGFAAAAASIVNGGTKVRPTFLKTSTVQNGERVISKETSDVMLRLLRLVVTDGTGSKANIPGYEIGGKTGTAEKPTAHGYSRNLQITSFVGAFPIANPEYLVFAMFDEPKGNKESFGFATAGWTAAPAVGRVVARIAPLLGVAPQELPKISKVAAAVP